MSWKPAVEMKPVSTPLRSRTAFVTTVVAPSTWSFARSICCELVEQFGGALHHRLRRVLRRAQDLVEMQFAVVVEKGEIREGAPGIKSEFGHVFLGQRQFCRQRGNGPDRPDESSSPGYRNPVMVEGYGMQPEPANTSAVCRYRLCLWRRPNALRVLAHQLLDHVEKHRSDRQCGFRQRKVIRGAKRDRCLDHRARQAPDIGPGKTRGAGGDGSRKYRRTKAVHDRRAERRNRLDFGDDVGRDTRPGQGFVDQAAQEVALARQQQRHIGKRRKRQRFGPRFARRRYPAATPETVLRGTRVAASPP